MRIIVTSSPPHRRFDGVYGVNGKLMSVEGTTPCTFYLSVKENDVVRCAFQKAEAGEWMLRVQIYEGEKLLKDGAISAEGGTVCLTVKVLTNKGEKGIFNSAL